MALYFSPQTELTAYSLKLTASPRHEQPEATIVIDLTRSEEEILAEMHPKGRYNIGVAKRHGVTVRQGQSEGDLDIFYNLLTETARRDGFAALKKAHYRALLDSLQWSFLLLAETRGSTIAGLLGVAWEKTGIYYYGASSNAHRNLMAPYLLQWEAMRLCKARGCNVYDFLGIEADANPSSSWKGMTDFKRKFGGKIIHYPPERQIILKPWMMRVLRMKRSLIG